MVQKWPVRDRYFCTSAKEELSDGGQGALLAVDDVLLQAGEDLAEAHGDGLGAQGLEHGQTQVRGGGAELDALHVIGGVDGADVVGHVAVAQLHKAQVADLAVGGDDLVDLVAIAAVQGLISVLTVANM